MKPSTGSPRRRRNEVGTLTLVARATSGRLQIGDIVQRSDIKGKNRYVVVNIQPPWIYTRRVSGTGGPGVITFPSSQMLKKVG